MRLVSPEVVLKALGIQVQTGSLEIAGAALDAISPRFEQALEMRFAEGSAIDYYDVGTPGTVHGQRIYRCSYGDIRNVVVRTSPDGRKRATIDDGIELAEDLYVVNHTEGYVTLLTRPQHGYHALSIAYDVGYEVDFLTSLPAVPDWLAQAATTAAVQALQSNPANVAKDKTRFIGEFALPSLTGVYRSLLAPHFRPRAGMQCPDASEIENA